MSDERKSLTDGLRQIADWYDAHPEIDIPTSPNFRNFSVNSKATVQAVIRALGECKKEYADTLFTVSRKFGSVRTDFIFFRNDVCVRKIVGVETIPARIIPAQPEMVIPAETKEIVEWECAPVMAD